jgi:hypothetical protein
VTEDPNRLTDGGDGTGECATPNTSPIIQLPPSRGSIILQPEGWFCPPLLCQRPTSLDPQRADEQVVLANLTCTPDLNIDGVNGEVIEVVHYAVDEGSAEDPDTGEMRFFPRTSLILVDGRVFQTTSEVVVRQLARILRIFPDCPWNPPLMVEVSRKKSKRGPGYYHELRVIGR